MKIYYVLKFPSIVSKTPDGKYFGTVCFEGLAQSFVALPQIKPQIHPGNG